MSVPSLLRAIDEVLMSQRPNIPLRTVKMLWSESMGHCMNPQCHRYLFQNDANIGEHAHIEPNADGGDVSLDNLLVLCRHCHKAFDDNPQQWPRDVLRRWKIDKNSEIEQRFAERYSSFDDLQQIVVPILERNRHIFDSYGPTGDSSVDATRRILWLRFEGELIANNRRLEQILIANKELLHPKSQNIVEDFVAHAREFVQTREEEPVSRVNLFPSKLNSVFGIERVNGKPLSSVSPLQNFIAKLVQEGRFVSLQLETDQILTYREDGVLQELYLHDRPRVQQLYWSGRLYQPQTTEVRFGSLVFILNWLRQRGINFEWRDVTKLTEITIEKKYSVKFVYKYLLSYIDKYEVADRKNLIVVNLHIWADNDVDVAKTANVSEIGVHVLRQSEFFRFAYDNLL